MQINATLIGQLITFAIFVWFCMKFIWPHVLKTLNDRQKSIADGLAAADRSQRELEAAQLKVVELINEAKQQGAQILEGAQQRAHRMIEEAKERSHEESNRIMVQTRADITTEMEAARTKLYNDVADLAVQGAQKIIGRNVNAQDSQRLVLDLLSEHK
jgi:F-type H+-transporting ATPase subunit b